MISTASAARTITLITPMMITAVIWSSFVFKHGPRGHGQHGQEHANDHPDNERDHGITSKGKSRQERPDGPYTVLTWSASERLSV